jgi:hypothetical protein
MFEKNPEGKINLPCYLASNAEVLKRDNIAPDDVFNKAARIKWFGHVVRMKVVHWRGLIHRNKEFICGKGHSND